MPHGLHDAAQRIRDNSEDVEKLIAAVKALVVKNKDRRAKISEVNIVIVIVIVYCCLPNSLNRRQHRTVVR